MYTHQQVLMCFSDIGQKSHFFFGLKEFKHIHVLEIFTF